MESAVWGLLGTIAGALASIGATVLTTRSSHRLQSDRVREDRIERANAFQRQTLIDLQEAIHDALREVHSACHEDLLAYRKTGKWGENQLSEEVNERARLAQRQVTILVNRVEDDRVRAQVKDAMSAAAAALLARSQSEADINLHKSLDHTTQALETIGVTLRALY